MREVTSIWDSGAYLDPEAAGPRRWFIIAVHTGVQTLAKEFCDITGKKNREFLERLIERNHLPATAQRVKRGKSKWRGNNNLFLMKWLIRLALRCVCV